MSNSYKNKLYLRLKARIRKIKEDINEVSELYQLVQSFFIDEVNKYSSENNLENPLLSSGKEQEKKDELETQLKKDFHKVFRGKGARLKKLWSKVMIKSHPDKNSFEDEDTKKEREELYKDSVEAQEKGDIFTIIEAARSLKIESPEVSFDDLEILEKQLKKVKLDLDKIYDSYPWVYYFSNDSRRDRIMKSFFEQHSQV